ncbi:MAG: hypothetical protein JRJ12_17050 [Deltaproteobacteria bacterium]|nr:hypothetical protein [Deltaproteobacteria bacterium]MBW2072280.1 hypothetical protein [Deltaproteobacteria bacterium]
MLKNLVSVTSKFYEDQALIFLTFGGFGRYVLYLLYEEFKRLQIPEDKVRFLAFDTEQPHRDRLDLQREAEYLIHLDHFDGDIYVENEENRDLKKAVRHIPLNLLCDIEAGCKGVPAVGFVAFHKYDDLVITREALRLIDEVRAKNPGKKIKLIIISGMGGSVSNGMTIPFLYRVRERLREKKIRVEVFLATSEGYLGLQNIQEESVERNCVASAMLWEYAIAGRNGLVYPGKDGVRDRKMFDGRIAHRVYIFSGGAAETSLKYQAIASTIATCISTLELTKVGSYLDGDRVNYSAHILEREWRGHDGGSHPTALLTMNVAGLKADCLPQVFHCYSAKRFLQEVTKPLSDNETEKIKGAAISAFVESNLNEDELLQKFSRELPTLTRDTINRASVSEENVYQFLREKVDELQEDFQQASEASKRDGEVQEFIDRVAASFSARAEEIVTAKDNYLRGGLLYYEKLASLLDEKISRVSTSISRLEAELFEGTSNQELENLLEKLAVVTRKKKGIGDIVVRIGDSPTITLINQIIDTAGKLQSQRSEKQKHLLLHRIYDSLGRFVRERQEILKSTIYRCTRMAAELEREAEKIKRIGRSAFTYQKEDFDALMEHFTRILTSELDTVPTLQILASLGLPLSGGEDFDEQAYLQKLLALTRPDLEQLTECVDEFFVNDPRVYDYIKMMLQQFFMTLKLDRDRFPTLETSQCSFVLCTKKMYDRYRDDLFEGYCHIETDNPFNVLLTRHEEGFPFAAISYLHRINKEFRELKAHGKAAFGHIMADLDEKLPALDC